MVNRVGYAAGVVLTLYVAVVYLSSMVVGLFLMELILPVVFFALAFWQARRLEVSLSLPPTIKKGEEDQILVTVKNQTLFPIPNLLLTLEYGNPWMGGTQTFHISGMADGRCQTMLSCKLKSDACGPLFFRLKSAQIYDFLKLTYKSKKLNEQKDVLVMPQIYDTSLMVGPGAKNYIGESDYYDTEFPGDDPSELFQIREYKSGDRLRNIHWKLSAKSEQLLIKEPSRPIGCGVVLFLDFWKGDRGVEEFEGMIEVALSLSNSMQMQDCRHYVAWFDEGRGDIQRKRVESSEDLLELTFLLLQTKPYAEMRPIEKLYRNRYLGETYYAGIYLNSRLELVRGGDLVEQLNGDDLQQSLKQMSFIL